MTSATETPTARDIAQRAQDRFGQVAANYRESRVHAAGRDLELIAASLPAREGSLVLDAGCGAGHTALAVAPRASQVIALDFTPAMLRQTVALAAERRIANVRTQLGDVERLPFPAASFDAIVSRYSAHHWLHPPRALSEFRRALKADGCLLLSDITAPEDFAADTFLQALELLRDPSHVRDCRVSEWQAMLATAGFDSEVIHRFDLRLHFMTWTRRMATPRQNADMIKALFRGASGDIRAAFQLPASIADDDFDFTIPGAVIRGIPDPDAQG